MKAMIFDSNLIGMPKLFKLFALFLYFFQLE